MSKNPTPKRDRLASIPDSKLPIGKMLNLRLKHGYSYDQLAKTFNVPRTSVYTALAPIIHLIDNPNVARGYADNRVNVLTAVEAKLVSALADSDKIKAANINNIAYAYQQINTARRLESGQSTHNVMFADVSDALEAARERRERIEMELLGMGCQDFDECQDIDAEACDGEDNGSGGDDFGPDLEEKTKKMPFLQIVETAKENEVDPPLGYNDFEVAETEAPAGPVRRKRGRPFMGGK